MATATKNKPLNVIVPDARYSVAREFTGAETAQIVVRFCDEFIGGFESETDAQKAVELHAENSPASWENLDFLAKVWKWSKGQFEATIEHRRLGSSKVSRTTEKRTGYLSPDGNFAIEKAKTNGATHWKITHLPTGGVITSCNKLGTAKASCVRLASLGDWSVKTNLPHEQSRELRAKVMTVVRSPVYH